VTQRKRSAIGRAAAAGAACIVLLAAAAGNARSDEIRVSTLANASLALEDRDNGINPYDFGRNPSWLFRDYDYSYIRFIASIEERSGHLRREYDPNLINDLYLGFSGIKTLGSNQVVRGYFDYRRLDDREVYRNLEFNQYNDPFYLDDLTTGDFQYYGPRTSVDWALRLRDDLYIGAGFDYDISTGLKQVYTRPEIVHNYFRGNFGLTWLPGGNWSLGLAYRPTRLQNRTEFAKPDEGYDNVIQGYAGDAIYEVRTFSSYTITEVEHGHEGMLQAFWGGAGLKAGLIARVGISENDVKYNATRQYPKGYWREDLYDVRLKARYSPEGRSWTLGVLGGVTSDDGWGIRPEYPEVLLYDNPYLMYTAGIGGSWRLPGDVTFVGEYIMEKYDIEVSDFGANLFRSADVISNIGRVAVEKKILNVYSFRGGFEYVDFPVDRWLKLPYNIDTYRVSGGLGYYIGGWEIDLHLAWERGVHEDIDLERQDLAAMVWFTRIIQDLGVNRN
jgi:hypothetical protein